MVGGTRAGLVESSGRIMSEMVVIPAPSETVVLTFEHIALKDAVDTIGVMNRLPGYWASSITGQGKVTLRITMLKWVAER